MFYTCETILAFFFVIEFLELEDTTNSTCTNVIYSLLAKINFINDGAIERVCPIEGRLVYSYIYLLHIQKKKIGETENSKS